MSRYRVMVTLGDKQEMWDDVLEIVRYYEQREPHTYHLEGFKIVIDSWVTIPAPLPAIKRSDGKTYLVDSFTVQLYDPWDTATEER